MFCSHHYQVPKIPAQPTSFHPTYVNLEVGVKSKHAHKITLAQSKSAPQRDIPDEGETLSVSKASVEVGKCLTPPARASRKDRPMSSYIPIGEWIYG